mmetsp:Transcript_18460/g.50388  ORF Transcript_18460/g.50388 Transcript_18460/m.50388 type:complete len:93 (+) Transcript_18460:153-431(+)
MSHSSEISMSSVFYYKRHLVLHICKGDIFFHLDEVRHFAAIFKSSKVIFGWRLTQFSTPLEERCSFLPFPWASFPRLQNAEVASFHFRCFGV